MSKVRLRTGGFLADTPSEQPIPEQLGGASFSRHTLPASIGWTASVTTLIGRLCLTGYGLAARNSLRPDARNPHATELWRSLGPGLVAPQDSWETDQNAPCTTLTNPDGFKFLGKRPQKPVSFEEPGSYLKGARISSASATISPFTPGNTRSPSVVALNYLE